MFKRDKNHEPYSNSSVHGHSNGHFHRDTDDGKALGNKSSWTKGPKIGTLLDVLLSELPKIFHIFLSPLQSS